MLAAQAGRRSVVGAVAVLIASACSPDSGDPVTPQLNAARTTTVASAEDVCPTGTCVVFGEDQKLSQIRLYPNRLVNCQVNAIERNQIGRRYHRDGSSHLVANETDAILLVQEKVPGAANWTVTHVGRTRWTARFWWNAVGDPTSWNSSARGVVAPWPAQDRDPRLDLVLYPSGSGADLELADLSDGAPFIEAVDNLAAENQGDLWAADCRLNVEFFQTFAAVNQIDVYQPVPKGR